MTHISRAILVAILLTTGVVAAPLGAQMNASVGGAARTGEGGRAEAYAGSADESRVRPPAFATGVTAGAMSFSGGRSEQGVAVMLQYAATPWLTLSAAPGFAHTSYAQTSASGLTDVPLSAGVWRTLHEVPWSPTISGSLYTTLSPSSSTSGVGIGRNTVGASGGVSGWATSHINLTFGASHPLSANSGNGSIELGSAYSLGKATANVGIGSEVGSADSSAVLSRSVAGGVAVTVSGPLTLTIDGSRGLTSSAPSWTLSFGFGTAFAGLSPLNPTSPIRRLNRVFGSRASAPSGFSKAGNGSCKRTGTC
ncbi:MAG TPA: hypothetical protein VIF32_03610 [Gemmatimonadaceae bacterium]|jgi:hypothetical protein